MHATVALALALALSMLPARAIDAQPSAQASVVPATHSVYDWLLQQRVFGRLPEFEAEELPMSRERVLEHLRTLERDSAKMSATDRSLLRDYLNEFDFKRLESNGVLRKEFFSELPHSVIDAIRDRRDPYLYAGPVGDSTIEAALWVRKGTGYGWTGGAPLNAFSYLYTQGARAFVNASNGLGFHAEVDISYAHPAWIFRLDPRLGVNVPFLRDSTFPPTAYEAWVSYARRNLFIAMGKGSSVFGAAVTDPVLLRLGAPNTGQLRLTVGPPKLHLTFVQGQLDGDVRTDTTIVNGRTDVFTSPVQRWFALTRITWNVTPRLGISLNQMNVYSQRGVDFEYLNPLLPSLYGGLDKASTDNGFIGFDVVARPFNGTELKYSALIDDAAGLGFKPIGNAWAKIALTTGVEQRLPFDFRLGASYTRVDAYVYTSGMPTDAWEIRNVPLGAQIGPNADEVAFRLTRWLPFRTRIMIGTRHIRKGLDPLDSQGKVTIVGGDIGDAVDTKGPFLAGSDLQTYRLDEIQFQSELIRGLTMTGAMQSVVVIGGSRTPGTHSWLLRWSYGF